MTRMAAVQMASGPRVPDNLDEAGRQIASAAASGAKLVVLPENFALMPLNDADRLTAAEPDGKGPIQDFLAAQARQHRVWLVGGTIPLAAKSGNKVRAACLVFNDRGERVARYDKIHLFDVQLDDGEKYHESNSFEPGEKVVVVDTPYGKLGLAVCYDLRFPELFRRLQEQGAEIFAVPSAFTAHTGKAHWEVLVRARAIENLVYVIAAAQDGRHANGRETYGDSMVVNPWGEVLARLPHGAGHVIAECDHARLQDVRRNLPSIRHRRLHI
ncbi:MAG: carbon-nitrogen hydrolase family protein [Gammaproteobacteria bacterium]|nr:carbon-nitrogen hydrolase family protein [Gammaproteobacteria bacterium]